MTTRKVWTADEVRALGVRTDLPTAAEIVCGVGKSRAWELFHAGALPFKTLPVGARRVIVPVADILRLLGLDTPDANGAGSATDPATATTNIELTERLTDDGSARAR